MKKNKITDLQTLRFEKQRISDLCKQKEEELNESFEQLQNNFGGIIIKSLFHTESDKKSENFEFVKSIVANSFDDIVEIATNKENRTENIKSLAKNIITAVISRVFSK
jgi:hypothetical protein